MVRVGLWGAFDVEDVGNMLAPRIMASELGRRLPAAAFRTWSPLGSTGWNRFDDPSSEPPAPFGTWSGARLDELAGAVDLLVIGGDLVDDPFLVGGVGPANEASVPTVWHAVSLPREGLPSFTEELRGILAARASVSVRDERSRELLSVAGVDREVIVVPDPILLVDRLFRADELEDRVAALRRAEVLPDGDVLVVQGSEATVPDAGVIAEQVRTICERRGLTPLLVEAAPAAGDGRFAAEIAERLPEARRLPSDAGVEELCALLGWSAGFVGSSPAAALIAVAFDRTAVVLDRTADPATVGMVEMLGTPERLVSDPARLVAAFDRVWERGSIAPSVEELRARLDASFDRLAALVVSEGSIAARLATQEMTAAKREEELQVLITSLTRRITEVDIRFTKLWRKIHKGDRHYAWQFERAEKAEELVRQLREEVAWLQDLVDERDRQLDERNRELERARILRRPYYWVRDRRARSEPPDA